MKVTLRCIPPPVQRSNAITAVKRPPSWQDLDLSPDGAVSQLQASRLQSGRGEVAGRGGVTGRGGVGWGGIGPFKHQSFPSMGRKWQFSLPKTCEVWVVCGPFGRDTEDSLHCPENL